MNAQSNIVTDTPEAISEIANLNLAMRGRKPAMKLDADTILIGQIRELRARAVLSNIPSCTFPAQRFGLGGKSSFDEQADHLERMLSGYPIVNAISEGVRIATEKRKAAEKRASQNAAILESIDVIRKAESALSDIAAMLSRAGLTYKTGLSLTRDVNEAHYTACEAIVLADKLFKARKAEAV